MDGYIPDSSIRRLSAYLRQLERLSSEGTNCVSSRQFAEFMKVGESQVRRDLTLFGQFGRPGVGYDVGDLIGKLRDILGTHERWPVVVIGAGELSHALLPYPGFPIRGFELVAAFDVDPKKVNRKIGGTPVYHMDKLEEILAECGARLAIVAVPSSAAQGVADRLVRAGIEGILNFAPTSLDVPPGTSVNQVDLAAHLERLSFDVSHLRGGRRSKKRKTPS